MINIYDSAEAYLNMLASLADKDGQVGPAVREILNRVKKEGDAAVRGYCQKFDGVAPDPFLVPVEQLDHAVAYLNPAIKDIWIQAIENIETFHRRQRRARSRGRIYASGNRLGPRGTWPPARAHPLDRS